MAIAAAAGLVCEPQQQALFHNQASVCVCQNYTLFSIGPQWCEQCQSHRTAHTFIVSSPSLLADWLRVCVKITREFRFFRSFHFFTKKFSFDFVHALDVPYFFPICLFFKPEKSKKKSNCIGITRVVSQVAAQTMNLDISRTTLGIAAGIAGTLFLSYCIYFDKKRRNDPEYKRKVRERK